VYAGDNFDNPANVIIRDFIFTQMDAYLGKLHLMLPDYSKTLLRVKKPLYDKEYFYSSDDDTKIQVEGTSKLEYLLDDPIVIKRDGENLLFDFSAKKENDFDKIAICFNDINCLNLVGVSLVEDKYSCTLIKDNIKLI